MTMRNLRSTHSTMQYILYTCSCILWFKCKSGHWLCDGTWQQISSESDAHTMAKVVELHETSVDIDMARFRNHRLCQTTNYFICDKQLGSFRDDVWRTESQKTMKIIVYTTINVHVKYPYSEHTSTMSPVNKTWNSDYQHQNKGTNQIWSFRDDVCRIES